MKWNDLAWQWIVWNVPWVSLSWGSPSIDNTSTHGFSRSLVVADLTGSHTPATLTTHRVRTFFQLPLVKFYHPENQCNWWWEPRNYSSQEEAGSHWKISLTHTCCAAHVLNFKGSTLSALRNGRASWELSEACICLLRLRSHTNKTITWCRQLCWQSPKTRFFMSCSKMLQTNIDKGPGLQSQTATFCCPATHFLGVAMWLHLRKTLCLYGISKLAKPGSTSRP